ncbi:C-GCAxxG-C-C family (seleno)protein [Acidaminobacterium chupaoyuni]
MLKEAAKHYYIDLNRSCSEAVFLAANEVYHLGATEESFKLIGAFSGGVCCGSVCGAVAGGAAALALKIGDYGVYAHENLPMRQTIKAFVTEVQEKMGSELCRQLKPQYHTAETRCLACVLKVCELLEGYMEAASQPQ